MPDPVPPAARPRRPADAVPALLVLAFAFLAASFAARNSDLWLHLAAGRLLADGGYSFGVDPFAATTAGVYWANHAWLADLGLFGLFRAAGGSALVVVKAALVALTAALMLRSAGSARGPFWVAAGCVLLAVLAASPRLLLQPACLSLLMLAGCLRLLLAGGRALHAVPVLIALWVNLDGWFVLGPLLVALFALGRRLKPGEPRLPLWLLPASLLACLASPHHIHALTLPPELSPAVWGSELRDDPRFAGFFASPWRFAAFGSSLAAWAYPVLLALGLISFALNRRVVVGWRGLVWLAFAALSAWQARLVPFFAVVAAPITALNIREVLGERRMEAVGRVAVSLAAVALGVLAWPGWLQGFHVRDRALAWEVEPDPTLQRTAAEVATLRERGELPADANVFPAHPDAAHYLAWFAPGERGFLDSRLQLFTGVAGEYERLSRAVGVIHADEASSSENQLLADRRIGAVLLYDPDPARLTAGLRVTSGPSGGWAVREVTGHAVILTKAGGRFDPERLAFGPPTSATPAAPGGGPSALPQPAEWWNLAAARARPRTWEGDAAAVYLRLFEIGREANAEAPSPGLPLLAVRSARAGLALRPDSDDAWLAAARATLTLGRATWEADTELTPRGFLRHAQTAAALFNAVLLNPDSAPAREALAILYAERQFLDLTLEQLQAQQRIVRRSGPLPGESPEARGERLARLAAVVEQTENMVQDAENRYLVRTSGLAGEPLMRARIARDLGLAGKATDVLVKSHSDLYGTDGLRLLLDLLLNVGQADAAGALLARDEFAGRPDALGVYELPGGVRDGRRWMYRLPAYDWFTFAQAAAAGRYDAAVAAQHRLGDRFEREAEFIRPRLAAVYSRQVASETGLALPPDTVLNRLHAGRERGRLDEMEVDLRLLNVQRADLHVLSGLLRLEQGDPAAAGGEFATAIDLYDRAKDVAPTPAGRPTATRYLDAIRRQAK